MEKKMNENDAKKTIGLFSRSVIRLTIVSFIFILLFIVLGCGGGTSTSFQSLYKQAEIEHKYNMDFNKQVVSLTDQMFTNEKFLIEKSIAMQKILDKKDKESEDLQMGLIWNRIDNVIEQFKRYTDTVGRINNYLALMKNGRIIWQNDGKNGSFYYKNRPIKFYLLKPDSNGKFGDVSSSKLELMDFTPSKQEQSSGSDIDMVLYGINSRINGNYKKGWEPESDLFNDYGELWCKGGPFIASAVRIDEKHHECICVIAKPGDIGTGILNGTFPFKGEDIVGELLDRYSAFLLNNVYKLTPERQEYLLNTYVKGAK